MWKYVCACVCIEFSQTSFNNIQQVHVVALDRHTYNLAHTHKLSTLEDLKVRVRVPMCELLNMHACAVLGQVYIVCVSVYICTHDTYDTLPVNVPRGWMEHNKQSCEI